MASVIEKNAFMVQSFVLLSVSIKPQRSRAVHGAILVNQSIQTAPPNEGSQRIIAFLSLPVQIGGPSKTVASNAVYYESGNKRLTREKWFHLPRPCGCSLEMKSQGEALFRSGGVHGRRSSLGLRKVCGSLL